MIEREEFDFEEEAKRQANIANRLQIQLKESADFIIRLENRIDRLLNIIEFLMKEGKSNE